MFREGDKLQGLIVSVSQGLCERFLVLIFFPDKVCDILEQDVIIGPELTAFVVNKSLNKNIVFNDDAVRMINRKPKAIL